MMLTVSYEDYINSYNTDAESVIPEGRFPHFILKAESYISSLTMGRTGEISHLDAYRECVFSLAEIYYKKFVRMGVMSENNDGYSASFSDTSLDKMLLETAVLYLEPTGLLYRGIG